MLFTSSTDTLENDMTPNRRAKLSPLFLLLAGVTLALASYGYFQLFTDYASMPGLLAILAVGGIDVAAVLFGKHALTVAEDGDSSLPWNLALFALTALGSYAQLAHALLAREPLAVGLVSAAFPIVTVLLFEGQLRRRYRLNGRHAGRLSDPRATVDLVTWVFYPGLAWRATKVAVLDRGLSQSDALIVAEALIARERAASEDVRPVRRQMRRTYADILAKGEIVELDVRTPAIESGTSDDKGPDVHLPPSDKADNGPDNADEALPRGAVSRAVRAAVGRHGAVFLDVLADVRTVFPDVKEDTVRVTMSRFQKNPDSSQVSV